MRGCRLPEAELSDARLGRHRFPAGGRSLRSHGLHRQYPPSLLGKFRPGLSVRVEEGEVADDDRNGEGDGQDPHEGAQRPDEHAEVGLRCYVPVADGRHGNHGPPESNGDRGEVVVGVVLDSLGVVDEACGDDDADDEEEDEQEEFVGARLERVDEDLQPGGMPGQLEQPHDADDVDELQDVVFLLQPRQQEVQVEGQRRHEVDYVHRSSDEIQPAWAYHEPRDQLEREPGVACTLEEEEGGMGFGASLTQHPLRRPIDDLRGVRVVASAASRRGVANDSDPHRRVRLEAEGEDGHEDEEDGQHR